MKSRPISSDNPPRNPSKSPIDPQWTILKILQWTTTYFSSYSIDSPRLTAEILLAYVLDIDRIDLYLRFDQPLNKLELNAFKRLIKRRLNREPVAYITGTREFWGLDFDVTPDVLIPRPETEFLVEESLKLLSSDISSGYFRLLDLGTGSGAIIVSLAVNRPGHHYFASDISIPAITIAANNAAQNNVSKDICFFVGKFFDPISSENLKFDIIVSNPPYIPSGQISGLEPEVAEHEPVLALDGGSDGFDSIENIIENAPLYLKRNGKLMMEIGFDQKNKVEQLIAYDERYAGLLFISDYSGHDRVAQVCLK